jgi:hypothetical protein
VKWRIAALSCPFAAALRFNFWDKDKKDFGTRLGVAKFAQVKLTFVINQAKANPIKKAKPSKYVTVKSCISSKTNTRIKTETQHFKRDIMAIGLKSGHI